MTTKKEMKEFESSVRQKTDEELQQLDSDLAEQRTEIRLRQNTVSNEIALRQALTLLNPELRRIVEIKLGGSIAPTGDVEVTP